jgi:hypothetical protein
MGPPRQERDPHEAGGRHPDLEAALLRGEGHVPLLLQEPPGGSFSKFTNMAAQIVTAHATKNRFIRAGA